MAKRSSKRVARPLFGYKDTLSAGAGKIRYLYVEDLSWTLKLISYTKFILAGVVAQWYSACLACVRHWVQSLAPHKNKIQVLCSPTTEK